MINKNGLEVTVGEETYFPSCEGTLEFLVNIKNTTGQPIILSMSSDNLSLYGSDDNDFNIRINRDKPDDYCNYYLEDDIESIQPNESISLFVINRDSLSGLKYIDFAFEAGNRLAGLKWRLILPR
jgi:hypothetical protein